MNKYDDIDFCLNLLYKVAYKPTPNQDYYVKKINIQEINLIDIKKNNTFDPTVIFKYGTFKFLNQHENKWSFKRKSNEGFDCEITIGKYNNINNKNSFDYSELYNTAIHYIASELVLYNECKHILLPIMFFDISSDLLKELNGDIYNKIYSSSMNDLFNVFITEKYFKMRSLKYYLINNKLDELEWKILLFQILFTLFKLNAKFNGFMHNKLNLDAVKLYFKEKTDNIDSYKIHGNEYLIPDSNISIKVTNFEYSNANNYIINNDALNIEYNSFYDIYFFCKDINKEININLLPSNIKNFILYIINSKDINSIENISNKNPSSLLKSHSLFNEFITIKSKNNVDSITDPISTEPRFLAKKLSPLYNMIAGSRYLESSESHSESKKNVKMNKKSKKVLSHNSNSSNHSGGRRHKKKHNSSSSSASSRKKHYRSKRHSTSSGGGSDRRRSRYHSEHNLYKNYPPELSQQLNKLPHNGEIPDYIKDNLLNYMQPQMQPYMQPQMQPQMQHLMQPQMQHLMQPQMQQYAGDKEMNNQEVVPVMSGGKLIKKFKLNSNFFF